MKALRSLLLSVVLVALFATTGYTWTTNGSVTYGDSSTYTISSDSIQPVYYDGYYRHRFYRHHFRPYPYRYGYYDPYYSDPYYYGPRVRVDVPFFSFGFR